MVIERVPQLATSSKPRAASRGAALSDAFLHCSMSALASDNNIYIVNAIPRTSTFQAPTTCMLVELCNTSLNDFLREKGTNSQWPPVFTVASHMNSGGVGPPEFGTELVVTRYRVRSITCGRSRAT